MRRGCGVVASSPRGDNMFLDAYADSYCDGLYDQSEFTSVSGGLLTRCCRRFIPCKTASIISSGDLAWRQSRVSSAASIILRMALIEEALCAWLYWYAALVLSGALAISDTHDCCAAHSVLPIMAVALRLLCTLTSNIADFPPWRRTF